MRKYRKTEHIENFLRSTYVGDALFSDIFLYNDSIPEIDYNEIDTSVDFLNKKIKFPLMINAMTGGSSLSEEINKGLASVALEFDLPMAVGSQSIALEDEDSRKSFEIVREIIKEGIVISNLSGFSNAEDAKKAVDLLNADAIQIHLNPAQELVQIEGERNFCGILKNIEEIVKKSEVPVIVKEVGFGMSKKTVKTLYDIGVRNVDVSGYGGSNFFEIENLRDPNTDFSDLFSWGIPTSLSIIEAKSLNLDDLYIISAGGVKNSMDIVKSLAIGASMTAISGEILAYIVRGGYDYTLRYIDGLIEKTKMLMVLNGAKNISELQKVDYKVTGKLKELLEG
ncbi:MULTISPECIES: type 2 isopentenyl-diphosphate Delta-isomerase [Peptoniphilus]|jgi:isopentenyl-diphosphate delta-isomerase, type 2|uniref:type 2 isopentenyl-diphosphate Delta-isomerase n=1 Tax=Peptoniphilus TaxID=162289 RepID=UPI002356DD4B|nr:MULTISPECIES: type 2 isopentenyl-diphosphate Delta-isomerase [Peptoniphilus]MDU1042891.1 type 2 isopentenyl-diphosphate Delta-isomerase [Peptoniphilus rhinitidis]MDU1954334.1 type 2 isopentenyl-diphosphate Delta-isomerase [Peptoniphilus lacydonensis]MDU2109355.1 type 2 isopentenyl-diphosphate Delta-isomerase [Peptoniphilus lacydonensis]MDU3751297.1 type 2 isopentenyl-diphosphate Delta-isomerase [Peptoniphilus rhinitidis]MDU5274797.1 type 2 isopentenyl-diphosphate Delta-isomerase [Peptoniphi